MNSENASTTDENTSQLSNASVFLHPSLFDRFSTGSIVRMADDMGRMVVLSRMKSGKFLPQFKSTSEIAQWTA